MSSNVAAKVRKASKAFGSLPPEVLALGTPISVHGPDSTARLFEDLAGLRPEKALATWAAVGLPVLGLILAVPFFLGIGLGTAPPLIWLFFSALPFGLSVVGLAWLWYESSKPNDEPSRAAKVPGLILYETAIVQVSDDQFTVIPWEQVRELTAGTNRKPWQITAQDGRKVDFSTWLEDQPAALQTAIERVIATMLPRFVERIEKGETVEFGKFGVSQRSVFFKGNELPWDQVTSMKLVVGTQSAFHIFRGGVLPWCNYDLMRAPNGRVAEVLLRMVAPPRLLVRTKA